MPNKSPYSDVQRKRVLALRKLSTPAEQKLWAALRQVRLQTGLKFRRQHPIGPYVADFFCHSHQCVIEIDGSSHDARVHADKVRDGYMQNLGYKILRYTEADVQKDVEAVVNTILSELNVTI